MSHCPNCGSKVQPGDRFCTNCGATLQNDQEVNQRPGVSAHPQESGGQPAPNEEPAPNQKQQPTQFQTDNNTPETVRGQGQQPARPSGHTPDGRATQEASRRDLLRYGGAGAIVLAAGGAGWKLLESGGFTEDFETEIGDAWQGSLEAFEVVPEAMTGDHSARLAFQDGTEVWRAIPETTPSEISVWWKTSSVFDNEFTIWFHDVSEAETPSMENAHFGFEVGAENKQQVVTAPPFENRFDYEVIVESPQADTWYQTRFRNIDFEAGTFDIALLNEDQETVGEVQAYEMAGAPTAINAVQVRNHMNYTTSSAHIDQLVVQ